MSNRIRTPAKIWAEMVRGNQRFISGKPRHPRQDVERRSELAERQAPDAALFGCSDSRLAAEIIFDKGLGDLFVVRNAGQVVSDSVLGSLEYAVEVLQVPLIIVLGHDECGAVLAAIAAEGEDPPSLPEHTRAIIDRIIPAVHRVREAEDDPTMTDAQEVGREHLRDTVAELIDSSDSIRRAVDEGRLGIVGANYRLLEGRVVPDIIVGNIEPA